jgi:hypothetical protein
LFAAFFCHKYSTSLTVTLLATELVRLKAAEMSAWYVGLLVSGMGKVWLLLQPEGCAPLVAASPLDFE